MKYQAPMNAANTVATLTPSAPLANLTTYTATLNAGVVSRGAASPRRTAIGPAQPAAAPATTTKSQYGQSETQNGTWM